MNGTEDRKMSPSDWLVITGSLAAIGWVNWYFFVAGRTTARASASAEGRQEQVVTVHGGYDPAEIHVAAGAPVRLVFDRQERSSCSEELLIPHANKRVFLPPFEKTAVDLPAMPPGRYEFSCGMHMLHGAIVAE
jgi:plastocyanin domain-containing protein